MKRYLILLVIACFVLACNSSTSENQDNDTVASSDIPSDTSHVVIINSDKIVPGESIGKITLGQTPETVTDILGKPHSSDAAMGKAWMTWIGKRDEHNNQTELNVYTTYKDSTMKEKVVKQIRTTSSTFSTINGVHVYSSLEEIKVKFPDLKEVATYASATRHFTIYDYASAGIAFDIVDANGQKICTGITVHQAGEPVIETYIYLHPGMEKVE